MNVMAEQLVVFNLNEEEYALPVHLVKEITKIEKVTPVPEAPAYVKGIINLRGRSIPLLDMHQRLSLGNSNVQTALIAEVGGTTVGLAVDNVKEVSVLGEAVPTPSIVNTPLINGIINIPGRIVILLELANLVADSERLKLESLLKA